MAESVLQETAGPVLVRSGIREDESDHEKRCKRNSGSVFVSRADSGRNLKHCTSSEETVLPASGCSRGCAVCPADLGVPASKKETECSAEPGKAA